MENLGLEKIKEIYNGKKVLLTGHTGFKGSWLALLLKNLGAEVIGLSNTPADEEGPLAGVKSPFGQEFEIDIADKDKVSNVVSEVSPDIIFHLAAQSLVSVAYEDPHRTYLSNVMGTLNLLEAFNNNSNAHFFLNVTTDKCYDNQEKKEGYLEDDRLGGHDPYSASKGCVEVMSLSFQKTILKQGKLMANVRSGNVIGGGDWAKDRLIPDVFRAIRKKEKVLLRAPQAIRPWQHVLDPLWGYIVTVANMINSGEKFARPYNFGPLLNDKFTVQEVINVFSDSLSFEHDSIKDAPFYETNLLLLNCELAQKELKWSPLLTGNSMFAWTARWYEQWITSQKNIIQDQIDAYISMLGPKA